MEKLRVEALLADPLMDSDRLLLIRRKAWVLDGRGRMRQTVGLPADFRNGLLDPLPPSRT